VLWLSQKKEFEGEKKMSWRDNDYYRYFVQQPLITRTYLAGIVAVSLPPLLYLMSPIWFLNYWDYTLRGEIWRPLAAFLFGGGGLNLLFGIFFAYQYSLKLETGKFGNSTADYAFYMFCSMINLMVSTQQWQSSSAAGHL
jgi:Derlin-2/3